MDGIAYWRVVPVVQSGFTWYLVARQTPVTQADTPELACDIARRMAWQEDGQDWVEVVEQPRVSAPGGTPNPGRNHSSARGSA